MLRVKRKNNHRISLLSHLCQDIVISFIPIDKRETKTFANTNVTVMEAHSNQS